jgi:hypothetical protein
MANRAELLAQKFEAKADEARGRERVKARR